jgi:hypothetical protein
MCIFKALHHQLDIFSHISTVASLEKNTQVICSIYYSENQDVGMYTSNSKNHLHSPKPHPPNHNPDLPKSNLTSTTLKQNPPSSQTPNADSPLSTCEAINCRCTANIFKMVKIPMVKHKHITIQTPCPTPDPLLRRRRLQHLLPARPARTPTKTAGQDREHRCRLPAR